MSNHEKEMLIAGPVGNIQTLITEPENPKVITAIICHPHPLYGGTMNNKVVTTISNALLQLGITTLRFNFRGIGKTEGSFDKGDGETQDCLAMIQWVKEQHPKNEIWLAGFSFGSYVATRVAAHHSTQYPIKQLISIAPAVKNFKFVDLPPVTCPWVVVQGDKDDVVDPQAVYDWIDTLDPKPQLIRMPEAGHFFHGQLVELRELIKEAVSGNLK